MNGRIKGKLEGYRGKGNGNRKGNERYDKNGAQYVLK
jgi:hypothetical protein